MEFRTVIPFRERPARCRLYEIGVESSDPTAAVLEFWITTRRPGIASRAASQPPATVQEFRIRVRRRSTASRVAIRLFRHFRPVDSTWRGGLSDLSDHLFWIPSANGFPATNEGITSRRTGCPISLTTADPTTAQTPVTGGL